jgi:hypothetical protein
VNHGRLFSAGVIGGVAFSVLAAVLRAAGIRIDLELWLGSVVLAPQAAAWLIGFFWHITLSGFIAILYGRAFVALGRATPLMGMRVALAHIVVSGLWLGLMPSIHPRIGEDIAAPGFFLSAYGVAGVSAFIAVHLVFGAVVGALAEPMAARIPVTRGSRVFHTTSTTTPPRGASLPPTRVTTRPAHSGPHPAAS